MALTPEDVVNKRFQPTKFREGYDQDEVDDFLDEVVVELRRLNQENDELRQRLATYETGTGQGGAGIRPATASDAATASTPVETTTGTDASASDVPDGQPTDTQADADTQATDTQADAGTDHAVEGDQSSAIASTPSGTDVTDTDVTGTDASDADVTGTDVTDADTAVPATSAAPVTASASTGTTPAADNAAGLLAMAQRIHDEYVNSGIEQRDSIIAEAQSRADAMISDAEEKRSRTLNELAEQKSALENQVEQLRGFERDYRSRLKEYIESQLRDLETTGSIEQPSDTV
ncbi:cell division protein DivIVA [Tersicoccus solisilvae]|uniref:Cell wall synthesis protein Wag31 n=1 Tax=Tersicoccus solisilvae TaxID=1882339 RepID=A0ABQ1PCE3_9MICC|nr:DivIVA domain-containing protein [Tersicoccus solisilvae]GGC94479.1 cell division protein DivIVA [Tersicoccus solisilvae]